MPPTNRWTLGIKAQQGHWWKCNWLIGYVKKSVLVADKRAYSPQVVPNPTWWACYSPVIGVSPTTIKMTMGQNGQYSVTVSQPMPCKKWKSSAQKMRILACKKTWQWWAWVFNRWSLCQSMTKHRWILPHLHKPWRNSKPKAKSSPVWSPLQAPRTRARLTQSLRFVSSPMSTVHGFILMPLGAVRWFYPIITAINLQALSKPILSPSISTNITSKASLAGRFYSKMKPTIVLCIMKLSIWTLRMTKNMAYPT